MPNAADHPAIRRYLEKQQDDALTVCPTGAIDVDGYFRPVIRWNCSKHSVNVSRKQDYKRSQYGQQLDGI